MNLVIEIPDDAYKKLCSCGYASSNLNIISAIKSGIPLDNVLDEIKAEFKSKADGDDWYHTTDGLVWEEAIEIIDKHKAERSGEE